MNGSNRRSYGQYCGLARALDIVGDRWNLLLVRELLIRPARYGELAASLPGIASNLLADRLRELVGAGVVERRLSPGGNGVVYALTPWGADLRDAVNALIRWSTPLMKPGPGGDVFQPQWLAVALQALLSGRTSRAPITVGVETAGVTLAVRLDEAGPQIAFDPDRAPRTVLRADPDVVLGLAAGVLSVDDAIARSAVDGDARELVSVFGSGD